MDVANEILDAIEIIVDKKIRENAAQIYPGICKSVSGSNCVMSINGKDNTIQFYGSIPTIGAIYRVFVPDGNMSMAFAITGNDDRKGLHYSNPNLLDNWYFGNSVDQRHGRVVVPNTTYYSDNTLTTAAGTTSDYVTAYRYATGTANGVNYASFKLTDSDTAPTYYAEPGNVVRGYTGAEYGLDRWKGYDSGQVVLIYNDHISIKHGATNGIIEFFDKDYFASLSNKTMTLSYLLMNNILLVHTFTTGNIEWWYPKEINGYRIEFGHTKKPYVDIVSANDIDVKAAKLELGTQQTLAHQDADGNWVMNEIPDYGEQLARCQRYFQLYSTADNRPSKAVDCRPTMRTDPSQGTIIIDGTTYYYNTADL